MFQVDLKCITVGSGGSYYKTHLPKLGQNPESLIIPHSSNSVSRSTSDDPPFEVGERVRVLLGVDTLRDMQEGHGGWNDKMEEVCVACTVWQSVKINPVVCYLIAAFFL